MLELGGTDSLDLLEAEADEVNIQHCPGVVANVLPPNDVLPPPTNNPHCHSDFQEVVCADYGEQTQPAENKQQATDLEKKESHLTKRHPLLSFLFLC